MLGRIKGRGLGPAIGHSFRGLVLTVPFMLWSGCSLHRPLQSRFIGDLGHIEFRKAYHDSAGIVVGAPHGQSEPAAVGYAVRLAESTGAGIAIAYGFSSKRVAVTQPIVREVALRSSDLARPPASIYPEFKSVLREAADGPLNFYVGFRVAGKKIGLKRLEVATTGFSFEQARLLKEAFTRVRDRELSGTDIAALDIALDPLDALSWSVEGFKHHGVLMLAAKGLNLRLPAALSNQPAATAYKNIFVQWIREAMVIAAKDFTALPQVQITQLHYGKIELTKSARQNRGIVVAAPHGTFDTHTAGMVRRICSRTGLAGVVATGFTPTESGDSWRINVNRPTELRVDASEREIRTERAATTYNAFRNSVLEAAGGKLNLYFDIHQNGGQRIEVATVGLSREEAKFVKRTYRELRNQLLTDHPHITVVDLAIEPLDDLEVGAWAAKTNGILRLARKSLHFELPADNIMATASQREVYTVILTNLLRKVAARLGDARSLQSAYAPRR
ncbi:MAG: hypothetical protein ACM3SP_24030 [Chloroflexota bacterium]